MPVTHFPEDPQHIRLDRNKGFRDFVTDLLSHLYSGNVKYQDRMVSAYYHPQLSVFSDPFAHVEGKDNIQNYLHFVFGWLVQDFDIDIHHVSATPTLVSLASQSGFLADIAANGSTLVSPAQPYPNSPIFQGGLSEEAKLKRRGSCIIVDYTLKIKELKPLGHVLFLLGLLPFPTNMGLAPIGSGKTGLHVVSRLDWINDSQSHMHPTAFNEKGYITLHENVYTFGSQFSKLMFYPWYWIVMLISIIISVMGFVFRSAGMLKSLFSIQSSSCDSTRVCNMMKEASTENASRKAFGTLIVSISKSLSRKRKQS